MKRKLLPLMLFASIAFSSFGQIVLTEPPSKTKLYGSSSGATNFVRTCGDSIFVSLNKNEDSCFFIVANRFTSIDCVKID